MNDKFLNKKLFYFFTRRFALMYLFCFKNRRKMHFWYEMAFLTLNPFKCDIWYIIDGMSRYGSIRYCTIDKYGFPTVFLNFYYFLLDKNNIKNKLQIILKWLGL